MQVNFTSIVFDYASKPSVRNIFAFKWASFRQNGTWIYVWLQARLKNLLNSWQAYEKSPSNSFQKHFFIDYKDLHFSVYMSTSMKLQYILKQSHFLPSIPSILTKSQLTVVDKNVMQVRACMLVGRDAIQLCFICQWKLNVNLTKVP